MDKVKWQINSNGDLIHVDKNYLIEKDRLTDTDWMLHLASKSWMDFNEFIPVYFEALDRIGVKELTITANY